MVIGSRKLAFLILCCTLLAVACSQARPTIPPPPTPGPTGPSQAVASQPTPTVIGVNLSTPAPTVTVAPPATATPLPTTTPEPVILMSAEDFGTDRNPLTGELVADPSDLDRRPLAIKISNAPPQWVRPQSGLNDADLVFEHITEAGITRFTIIVYGKNPPQVGPIRSARLIDLELPAMYDAALVFSGSSDGVRQRLLNADFRPRIIWSYESGYFRTGADKPLEHTLYGKPQEFWQTLEQKGLNSRPTFYTQMAFTDQPPEGGDPASEIAVDYNWEIVDWKFDPESARYLRWADGQMHRDGNTGEQVSAANVVVIFAGHIEDPSICEQVLNGVCAAYSVQPQIFGSGPALIFRDGRQYEATWQRVGRYDMFTFVDANGQPLPLQVGNTWFEIVPSWYRDPVSVTP